MAQFLRPDGEITSTNITGSYLDIDEVTVSNTDFIVSTGTGTSQYECSTANVTAPSTGTHTVRYTCAQVNGTTPDSGGTAATLDVTLYQGATLISSDTQRTQDGAWTTYSWNLTAGEVSNITDYDDLRIRFDMVNSGGSPTLRRQYAVSHAEIEVPDAADNLGTPNSVQSLSDVGTDPTITQTHILGTPSSVQSTSPVGTPYAISGDPNDISSTSEVGSPLFTGISILPAPNNIQSLSEQDDNVTFGQNHNLPAADNLQSLSEQDDNVTFGQTHNLGTPSSVQSLSEVTTPQGGYILDPPNNIQSLSEQDDTVPIGQNHNLGTPNSVQSLSEVETTYTISGDPNDIESASQVGNPLFTGISVLPAANDIESAAEVGSPLAISAVADNIESTSEVGNPVVAAVSAFAPNSIQSLTTSRNPVLPGQNAALDGFGSYTANVAYSIGTTSSVTAWHSMYSQRSNCLVVCMSFMSSDVTTSPSKTYTVTFGGQSMTAAMTFDPPDNDFCSLVYYLMDPPKANSQLSISTNDAFRNITVSIVELVGINTGNPIGNTQTASAETVAITPETSNSFILGVKSTKEIGAGSVTPSTDNIEFVDFAGGGA